MYALEYWSVFISFFSRSLLKHEVEDFLKPALELGYCLWTIFFIVSCLKSEQCLVKLGDFYTFYDDYFWWSWNAVFILHLCSSVLCSKLSVFRKVCFACIFLQYEFWLLRSFYFIKLHLNGFLLNPGYSEDRSWCVKCYQMAKSNNKVWFLLFFLTYQCLAELFRLDCQ